MRGESRSRKSSAPSRALSASYRSMVLEQLFVEHRSQIGVGRGLGNSSRLAMSCSRSASTLLRFSTPGRYQRPLPLRARLRLRLRDRSTSAVFDTIVISRGRPTTWTGAPRSAVVRGRVSRNKLSLRKRRAGGQGPPRVVQLSVSRFVDSSRFGRTASRRPRLFGKSRHRRASSPARRRRSVGPSSAAGLDW